MKKKSSTRSPTDDDLVVAVDPGARCGYALCRFGSPDEIALWAGPVWQLFGEQRLRERIAQARHVWAFVERSSSLRREFVAHRSSATQAMAGLKGLAGPRRLTGTFIDPISWQYGLGFHQLPAGDSKQRARLYAKDVLGMALPELEDQEMVDARCLLAFALRSPLLLQARFRGF